MRFAVLSEHWELAIGGPANVEFDPKLSIFTFLGNFTVLISGRF